MAHGCLFIHGLFNPFIPCWLVSHLPRGFRALLCSRVTRVVSAAESQSTFTRQPRLPACNQLQHLCPSQTPPKAWLVSPLSSFPFGLTQCQFSHACLSLPSQGPTCHSRNRGCPSWDNLHSGHKTGGGSSEASENTAVHTTGRDPALLFLSSVPRFIYVPPPFPSHHFFNLHQSTSLPSWPVPSQTAPWLQAIFFIQVFFFVLLKYSQ